MRAVLYHQVGEVACVHVTGLAQVVTVSFVKHLDGDANIFLVGFVLRLLGAGVADKGASFVTGWFVYGIYSVNISIQAHEGKTFGCILAAAAFLLSGGLGDGVEAQPVYDLERDRYWASGREKV